jgi:putative heme uptake system protein
MMADEDDLTYLLVDGENLDGALGGILNHKPEPAQRPRWQNLLDFAQRKWQRPVRALFFINASRGFYAPFVQALIASGYRPIPLAGRADEKVVDIGIQRTLGAIRDRTGHVLLASHDADFVEGMAALGNRDGRKIGFVAFTELVSQGLRDVPGVQIFDLEDDAEAFDFELPRVRIIPLDEFDPTRFL